MNKFTIFTIILSVSVITIFADLLIRDYLKGQGLASLLSIGTKAENTQTEISPVLENQDTEVEVQSDTVSSDTDSQSVVSETTTPEISSAQEQNITSTDTTSSQFIPISRSNPVGALTETSMKQAGFTGAISAKQFTGKLFQLLDITNFSAETIKTFMVEQNGVSAASITEIVLRDEIQALQLYLLLQNKTKPYIDLSLNETNAYGDRSFYVNHGKKANEAFLTVKIKNRIYAFAYVKFYHPEIKKLIILLTEI